MKTSSYIVVLLGLIVFSCKKQAELSGEALDRDSIIYKDIKGKVYNLCTDSGLAGIKVYLEIYDRKGLHTKYNQISGINGEYIFENVELHTNPEYNYSLYIPSKSGFSAKDRESCGIKGGSLSFDLEDTETLLQTNVIPSFIYMNIYFVRDATGPETDTVRVHFEQNTYHKNVPDFPHAFGGDTYGSRKYFKGGVGNYPMGLYDVTIDTWKGGLHERKYDKLYIPYGDTAAYVVHW